MDVGQFESQGMSVAQILLDEVYGDIDGSKKNANPEERLKRGVDRATRAVAIEKEDAELSIEGLVWARAVASHGTANMQDVVVPDVPTLCQVLERHLRSIVQVGMIQNEEGEGGNDDNEDLLICKCQQLLQLIPESIEEGSRRHLVGFLGDVMTSLTTPEDLVQPCLQVWMKQREERSSSESSADILGMIRELFRAQETCKEDGLKDNYSVRILSILSVVGENPSIAPGVWHQQSSEYDVVVEENEKAPETVSPRHLVLACVRSTSDVVRQLAVTCLGQMGLWWNSSKNDKTVVAEQWLPLLLDTASSDEVVEIRNQALLAVSDWAMVDPNSFLQEEGFIKLVTQELERNGSNAGDDDDDNDDAEDTTLGLCLSSEIAAKILLRTRHPSAKEWLPHLIAIFFDARLFDTGNDDGGIATDIGSPARLQQLLSVFFPALCQRTAGREALVDSIGNALRVAAAKQRRSWPYAKMVAYLCDTARMAQEEPLNDNRDKANQVAIDAKAALGIVDFLIDAPVNLPMTVRRALCKILPGMALEEEAEISGNLLNKLRLVVEELEMELDDSTCLDCVAQVLSVLPASKIEEEDEDEEDEDTESEIEAEIVSEGEEGSLGSEVTAVPVEAAANDDGSSDNHSPRSAPEKENADDDGRHSSSSSRSRRSLEKTPAPKNAFESVLSSPASTASVTSAGRASSGKESIGSVFSASSNNSKASVANSEVPPRRRSSRRNND